MAFHKMFQRYIKSFLEISSEVYVNKKEWEYPQNSQKKKGSDLHQGLSRRKYKPRPHMQSR